MWGMRQEIVERQLAHFKTVQPVCAASSTR
jgi:hypothetical protein